MLDSSTEFGEVHERLERCHAIRVEVAQSLEHRMLLGLKQRQLPGVGTAWGRLTGEVVTGLQQSQDLPGTGDHGRWKPG